MRSVVALITMLATVLHLAVGCCGHLTACEGGAGCHRAVVTATAEAGCCADHDSEPGRGAATACMTAQDAGHDHGIGSAPAADHDCDGCRCAATIEKGRGDVDGSALLSSPALIVTGVFAARAVARYRRESRERPLPARVRAQLFERLVV